IYERKLIPEKALPVVAAIAAVLVWGGAWYVNASALAANRVLLSALIPSQDGNFLKNLDAFKESIALGTFGTQEAREQLAQASTQVAGLQVDLATKQAFFD